MHRTGTHSHAIFERTAVRGTGAMERSLHRLAAIARTALLLAALGWLWWSSWQWVA